MTSPPVLWVPDLSDLVTRLQSLSDRTWECYRGRVTHVRGVVYDG